MFKKLENPSYSVTTGTGRKSQLEGIAYMELLEAFGTPSFNEPSGDNKVQKEWVFEDIDGNIFTIYDYRTYDVEYTMTSLDFWNVGGKKDATHFVQWVKSQIEKD